MPDVTFINDTQVPLHICLKQVSPLHYANSVPPQGGRATMHTGKVWFTVQARIDRGGNTYDKFQTWAPIAGISIGALSLGAGAIYFVGASAAAGGTVAAVSAVAARLSAAVATHTPTFKRLLGYASKGKTVAKIGQVVGIGGGALAGAKSANTDVASTSQTFQDKAATASKYALKKLLQGSVLSSAGWYIDKDRTIRVQGGPKATITPEGLLVIETDTAVPFTLIDETGKTVAVGNQDGGDPVPQSDLDGNESDADDTELKSPGETVPIALASAAAAAAAPGGAPVLQADGRKQDKESLWRKLLKDDDKA